MSALFPAPVSTSSVHQTGLQKQSEPAFAGCYLSYKHTTSDSPLCFHHLTSCFLRKPCVFKRICVAPWCVGMPAQSLRWVQGSWTTSRLFSVGGLPLHPACNVRPEQAQRHCALLQDR